MAAIGDAPRGLPARAGPYRANCSGKAQKTRNARFSFRRCESEVDNENNPVNVLWMTRRGLLSAVRAHLASRNR